ncbi:hypothetical protein [Limnohabitans sp. T6-20]|uniref:hypothetical protein n=1 Tax=Limnohabitans sp. T6-20 TaxID=1100725 RepID=UPI0011B1F903|nr:hypothetical protein [Limnohabitans sp. T6-20]
MNQAQAMDHLLWGLAEPIANWNNHFAGAWELDYVRALHEPPGLQQLSTWLGQQSGQTIRMHSIWLDKHAWVQWDDPVNTTQRVGPCELADLAVVIRKNLNGVVYHWLWVLQAKRASTAFAKYSGTSSAHEIELLQQMPPFDLDKCLSGTFDLKPEFTSRVQLQAGSPWLKPQIPWTFLDFDRFPAKRSSAASQMGSPVAARWPAVVADPASWAGTHPQVNPALGSYAGCLLDLVNAGQTVGWKEKSGASGHGILPGGPVGDPGYKEWTRLYVELMGLPPQNGHAASPNNVAGTVHAFSQDVLSTFSILNQKQSFEYFDAPWSVGNSHRTWRFDGRHFISAALSEPYTERNGQRMSEFDNLEKAAARRFSGGEVGELNGGGRDGGSDPASPDDRPGGPAVTLFIDVLGPSDWIASEQED